jgi:hypothetical protein
MVTPHSNRRDLSRAHMLRAGCRLWRPELHGRADVGAVRWPRLHERSARDARRRESRRWLSARGLQCGRSGGRRELRGAGDPCGPRQDRARGAVPRGARLCCARLDHRAPSRHRPRTTRVRDTRARRATPPKHRLRPITWALSREAQSAHCVLMADCPTRSGKCCGTSASWRPVRGSMHCSRCAPRRRVPSVTREPETCAQAQAQRCTQA